MLEDFNAPFVLLEDRLHAGRPALLYQNPVEVVTCARASEVDAAFDTIERELARGLYAAGYLSYDLGLAFEPQLRPLLVENGPPLLWFGLFEAPKELDSTQLDTAFAALGPPLPIKNLQAGHDEAAHVAKVQRVLDYLAAGDAYQVNLTFDMRFDYAGDPLKLYGAMRARQPVAHGGVIFTGTASILSVSPELFLDVAGGLVTTRPMKGTVPRSTNPAADAAAISGLNADPKQRAENLMIVDLMRNDLSRISEVGSVEVPRLFHVETYPTLHTMTSTIRARLRTQMSLRQMMGAVFPCGSITGAPKHRAMQIIDELEARSRGVYTGSIGVVRPDGAMNFNVAIRTATLDNGVGHYGIGGGIVMDSQPQVEYAECLLKARVLSDLMQDFGLIETLKWSNIGGYERLELHLARLAASAAQLEFNFDRLRLEAELAALVPGFGGIERRIRIELARDGRFKLEAPILTPEPERIVRLGVACARLDAGDPYLRHKTTLRDTYETAFAQAQEQGLDEVVLLNREGFVCEAARNSIFVARGTRLLTPPLAHGLLPGILRQDLLSRGEAVESALRLDDLRTAERWYIGNSLRGLRRAVLAGG